MIPAIINITAAEQVGDYALRLSFDDGTVQTVDFKPFLSASPHPDIRILILRASRRIASSMVSWFGEITTYASPLPTCTVTDGCRIRRWKRRHESAAKLMHESRQICCRWQYRKGLRQHQGNCT
jgi:hypothetical protein